jgi:hypothetical protein
VGGFPFSFYRNRFFPDARGMHSEYERIEKEVGRYTVGFRHYESYYNYL